MEACLKACGARGGAGRGGAGRGRRVGEGHALEVWGWVFTDAAPGWGRRTTWVGRLCVCVCVYVSAVLCVWVSLCL